MTQPTTTSPDRLHLGVGSLMAWSGGVIVLVGGLLFYPAWTTGGRAGLTAEIIAAAAVLACIWVTGFLVSAAAAARGPAAAALTFIGAGLLRPVICAVLVVGAYLYSGPLPVEALVAHLAVFYVCGLTCETVWVYRGLKRCAHRAALESFGRTAEMNAIREGTP